MNNIRRKKIQGIINKLEIIKSKTEAAQSPDNDTITKLEALNQEIQETSDEEQESFDNMPESLQYSDRGAQSEAAIDALNEAISEAEGISSDTEADGLVDSIEAIIASLEEAMN